MPFTLLLCKFQEPLFLIIIKVTFPGLLRQLFPLGCWVCTLYFVFEGGLQENHMVLGLNFYLKRENFDQLLLII